MDTPTITAILFDLGQVIVKVDAEKFEKLTRKMDSSIIFFVIGFLIFLFGFPIMKLLLMSSFEQLNIRDAIQTTGSVMLITSLLVFLSLVFIQVIHDANQVEFKLENLANKIDYRFKKELNSAYDKLLEFNNIFSESSAKDKSKKSGANESTNNENKMVEGILGEVAHPKGPTIKDRLSPKDKIRFRNLNLPCNSIGFPSIISCYVSCRGIK